MPVEYTLTCHIHKKWVKKWKDGSVTFCFGRTTNGNDFELIASATSIDPTMTVKFEDEYCIAALDRVLETGEPIVTATSWADIEFGQKYVVDDSWTDIAPSYSPEAPEMGFLFQNTNVDAGVMIAKKLEGGLMPLYCTPELIPPHGDMGGFKLIPEVTVAVWFQTEDSGEVEKFVISLTGNTPEIQFGSDGAWSV